MQHILYEVPLTPKTKKELAHEFKVHPQTVRKWCKAIGIDTREILTIKEVRKFYDHYGCPCESYKVA